MHYMTDPGKLQRAESAFIEEAIEPHALTDQAHEIAMELVRVTGDTSLYQDLLFSDKAVRMGLASIKKKRNILCDDATIPCHLALHKLVQEPLCFTQKPTVISQAKANKQTRGMVALNHWKAHIENSIVLLGDTSATLFRLLERLEDDFAKPALIIAMSVGFTEAEEAKTLLWKKHQELGVECVIIQGSRGGSLAAATILNSLLKVYQQGLQVDN